MRSLPALQAKAAARWPGLRLPSALWLLVPTLAVLLLAPWLPSFQVTLLNQIGLAALASLGIVMLTGIAGMTTFGQAAFIGIGAYTTAWLTAGQGVPPAIAVWMGNPWAALAAGLVLTGVAATVLGLLTLRLSGHFLPLGTICWALVLYYLFGTSEALGAHTGISGLPALQLGSWVLDKPQDMVVPIWVACALALLACHHLLDSRTGRALRAMQGGQAMAASMGVHLLRTKLLAFVLASMLACVAGWLYALEQRFVSPAPFSLNAGIDILFVALLGGIGQLWGAIAGAFIVVLVRNGLQDWMPVLLGETGNYEAIVFGLLIVALMHRMPGGLCGWLQQRWPTLFKGDRRTRPAQADPLPRRAQPPRGETVLQATGVTRRFGGLVANRDIDLHLAAGEILAVIGPNGAGKSTLFNQLSCVDRPTSGSIRCLGREVVGWSPRQMAAAGLCRTFQHVKLLPGMSVLDNVALGAHLRVQTPWWRSMLRLDRRHERQMLAEAHRQLVRVGLGDLADREAGALALGQQRLLEIARALCADPAVLLLDEPAAGLRHQEKQALAALLRKLREEGMAVLLVEHDMDFVMSLADRVAVVVFGEKIVEGEPFAVQTHPKVREAYLGAEL